MNILVTGASGFLSSALIPKLLSKGHKVYGLSRHPPEAKENLIPLVGDITEPNLGIKEPPEDINTIYHLAAIHRLGEDKDGSIWQTNVVGTENVIKFCCDHNIESLKFVSSAYTQGRNPYEQSKALCETLVKNSGIPKVTVFKPAVVMGSAAHPYPGHFSQFISLVIKVHQRGEIVRRKIEGTLRLPVLEPVFRMKANPEGKLSLVLVDIVADAIAEIEQPGVYWLTHPNPPTIGQLFEWIGDFIMVKIKIEPNFTRTPIEAGFERLSAPFLPYLWGDDFPSDLKDCPPITSEFTQETIKRLFDF